MKARDIIPGWPKPRSTSANWFPSGIWGIYYTEEDVATIEYHRAQQAMVNKYFESWRAMKEITQTDFCNYCGQPIPPFDENSFADILHRKYVGGHGHLITLAYHRACAAAWLRTDFKMEKICTRPPPHICKVNGPCNGFPKD